MSNQKNKKQSSDLAFWEPNETCLSLKTDVGWKPGDPIGYVILR